MNLVFNGNEIYIDFHQIPLLRLGVLVIDFQKNLTLE